MRVAALFDIHANLPALEAVMEDVRLAPVDQIVISGDLLPGSMPRECLDLAAWLGVSTDFIIGNGDREALAAKRGTINAIIPEFFKTRCAGMRRS